MNHSMPQRGKKVCLLKGCSPRGFRRTLHSATVQPTKMLTAGKLAVKVRELQREAALRQSTSKCRAALGAAWAASQRARGMARVKGAGLLGGASSPALPPPPLPPPPQSDCGAPVPCPRLPLSPGALGLWPAGLPHRRGARPGPAAAGLLRVRGHLRHAARLWPAVHGAKRRGGHSG